MKSNDLWVAKGSYGIRGSFANGLFVEIMLYDEFGDAAVKGTIHPNKAEQRVLIIVWAVSTKTLNDQEIWSEIAGEEDVLTSHSTQVRPI